MPIVLPYNRAQHMYADALADRLREEDEEGLGIDRADAICPSCWLAYRLDGRGARIFGACPDCAREIGLS